MYANPATCPVNGITAHIEWNLWGLETTGILLQVPNMVVTIATMVTSDQPDDE